MFQLNGAVEVDKRFQNSINLQLDIENTEKLNSYIPTRSSVKILKTYLQAALGETKNRATILIGPYGKGKSHLLLVLLHILADRDSSNLKSVMQAIAAVDKKTAEDIKKVIERERPFLPVVVSTSGGDVRQELLLSLVHALKREGLEAITPESFYGEALKTIENWRVTYPQTYKAYQEALEEHHEKQQEFENNLEHYHASALELFETIYPELTAGSIFQPLIQEDVLKIYQEMNRVLCENYHYSGIYIVFDEFSKYIEGHEPGTFSRDMKTVQDICELANSSKEQQIHITFVAHKSIKEYGNVLSKDMINAFVGVEGRMKEVMFVVSSQNNYELIKSAIRKTQKDYERLTEGKILYKELIKESFSLPCFQSLFEVEDYEQVIAYGCFPLLPLTAYLLLKISEKVAQNERSIFTYLANEEPGTVVSKIEADEISDSGISADTIYDYFQYLFRENTSMTNIHTEWLKADFALGKTTDMQQRKVIKVMALLFMLNGSDDMLVTEQNIRLAAGLSKEEFCVAINALYENRITEKRRKTNTVAFKNNVGIDIEKEIHEVVLKQPLELDWCKELQQVSELEYVLPKQHNQNFKITRYFRYEFQTAEQFIKLKNAEYLFEEQASDGKIVALISLGTYTTEEIKAQVQALNDERIVVIIPKEDLNQEENIRRLKAILTLKSDNEFLAENKVLEQELSMCEEDMRYEINFMLEKLFLPENQKCIVVHKEKSYEFFKHKMEFNRLLSSICTRYYPYAPKVNNEMINRSMVSAQTRKARNQILKDILEGEDFTKYESGSSAEATIFRATMIRTGIIEQDVPMDEGSSYVLNQISAFLKQCVGERRSFTELYENLLGASCGARKGIIPIFIARRISMLEDTPVIYLQDKEVELTPEILNNINDWPQDYFIYVEKTSADKEQYIELLVQAFLTTEERKKAVSKNKVLTVVVEYMQRWFRSLPQYTLKFKELPSDLESSELDEIVQIRNMLKKMEINPREILFERIPFIYKKEPSYLSYGEAFLKTKLYLDQFLNERKKQVADDTRKIFGGTRTDNLNSLLKHWYDSQSKASKNHLMSDKATRFMNYLQQLQTHDEAEIVGKISKIVTDMYMEDWNDQSIEGYGQELKTVKTEIEGVKDSNEVEGNQNKISFTGSDGTPVERFYEMTDDSTSYFLENAITEALEEFGDTLETNQKVAVLVQALEKMIKQ